MEKYSKAVSEMYSQFKQREVHPMERYIGRCEAYLGEIREVVGNTFQPDDPSNLIANSSGTGDWRGLDPYDVIFRGVRRLSIRY